MEPIIQPSSPLIMMKAECEPAANPPQPEQSFNEVLLKQHAIVEKNTDPEEKKACQPVVNPPQPEQSTNKGPLKQHAIVDNSTDPKEKIAEETISSNFLPIIPTQLSQNKCNSLDPMKADLLGQAANQEGTVDPKNIRWVVNSSLLDHQPQSEGTLPKSELNPNLLNQMDGKVIESIGNSGETKDTSPKEGENVRLLGKDSMMPFLDTNSSILRGIDEKLGILLGGDPTKEEITGQSWNKESSGLGSSPAEKKSPNAISSAENQPTQDSLAVNELLGNPKPPRAVEETGNDQKPQLSKTENLNLSQQIAEKVIWSIKNNQEEIRLTLDPPQLGNLLIELHRDKEEIKATLWADNSKTKEILENNQFQLQKTLEADGFKLEKYEVFVQKDMGSFQGNEESPVFHGQQSRKQSLGMQETEFLQPLEILPGAIPGAGGSRYIDRFI